MGNCASSNASSKKAVATQKTWEPRYTAEEWAAWQQEQKQLWTKPQEEKQEEKKDAEKKQEEALSLKEIDEALKKIDEEIAESSKVIEKEEKEEEKFWTSVKSMKSPTSGKSPKGEKEEEVKAPVLPVVQNMISVTLEGGKQVVMPRAEAEKRNLLKPFIVGIVDEDLETTTPGSFAASESEPESEKPATYAFDCASKKSATTRQDSRSLKTQESTPTVFETKEPKQEEPPCQLSMWKGVYVDGEAVHKGDVQSLEERLRQRQRKMALTTPAAVGTSGMGTLGLQKKATRHVASGFGVKRKASMPVPVAIKIPVGMSQQRKANVPVASGLKAANKKPANTMTTKRA